MNKYQAGTEAAQSGSAPLRLDIVAGHSSFHILKGRIAHDRT
jgi:hypothetical protein